MTADRTKLVEERLREIQKQLWNSHDSNQPDEVSHYAPLEAFRKIVAARELWLTHQCDLGRDEPGELRHANEVINAQLDRKWIPKRIDRHNDNLWGLGIGWHHYCACLCRAAEQPHMWRDYAGKGNGCAIVFSFSKLLDRCDGGRAYWLAPMLYPRAEQSALVAKMLHRSRELSISLQIRSDERDEFWGSAMFRVGLGCGLRFKRQRFSSEFEVRLGLTRLDETGHFTANGKRRMKLPIDLSTVCHVVRGPNTEPSLSEVKEYLEQCGWNVPVLEATRR